MSRDVDKLLQLTQKAFEAYVDAGEHSDKDTIDLWVEAKAEKERADKAEQHNVELCKQILETEARERKLREALEKIKRLGWSVCFGGGYEYGGEYHAEALSIAGTVLASLYPKEETE